MAAHPAAQSVWPEVAQNRIKETQEVVCAIASSVVTAMLLVEMPLIYTVMVRQTVMLAVPRAREEGVAGWEAETNHVIGGRDQRSEVRVVSGAGVPGVLCPLYVVDAGGVANQVGLVHVIEGAGAKATEIAQV